MLRQPNSCRLNWTINAVILALAYILAPKCEAVDRATTASIPFQPFGIEPYEPTVLGYTKQSDDVPFVDIQLSFKYRLLPVSLDKLFKTEDRLRFYLTFTGRFGFYVQSRPSGPVIGKEYNPKLLVRWLPDTTPNDVARATATTVTHEYANYLDFAYAHDSNGQTIDTPEAFSVAAHNLNSINYALDQISRGWDYVQATGKWTYRFNQTATSRLSVYPDFKFFLRHGFLQKVPEEYNSWEHDPNGHPRHEFDGVSVTAEYRPFVPQGPAVHLLSDPRLSVQYKTGYDPVAKYNTVRGELGFQLLELPMAIWAQEGYLDSLARYYKKAHSIGIELRIAE